MKLQFHLRSFYHVLYKVTGMVYVITLQLNSREGTDRKDGTPALKMYYDRRPPDPSSDDLTDLVPRRFLLSLFFVSGPPVCSIILKRIKRCSEDRQIKV